MCSPYTDALVAGAGTLKTVTVDLGTDAPCGFLPADLANIQSSVRAWLLARRPSLAHDLLHSVAVRPSGGYIGCGAGCDGSYKSSSLSSGDGAVVASSSDDGCGDGSDDNSKRPRLAGLANDTSAGLNDTSVDGRTSAGSLDAAGTGLAGMANDTSAGANVSAGSLDLAGAGLASATSSSSDGKEGGDKGGQRPGAKQGTSGAKL